MLTDFQKVKNNMYDVLLNRLTDTAFLLDENNKRKYKFNGIFSAPTITPNIGSLDTEIVEPQLIIKSQTLKILNEQIAKNAENAENAEYTEYAKQQLSQNDILEISSGDAYINNEFYKIVKIEPDSNGLIVLILRKVILTEHLHEVYYDQISD